VDDGPVSPFPAGTATVVDLGPGESDEDAAERLAEREAIRNEEPPKPPTDEEWLSQFPVYSQLEGMNRRTFREDALAWRDLDAERNRYGLKVAERANKVRKMGPWLFSQRTALKKPGPEKWRLCPPKDAGGCGGSGGNAQAGGCGKCHGHGYLTF
jgi:hypothetical protein